MICTAE